MPEVVGERLPFQEAIDAFRSKIGLPSQAWTDLKEGMHARAFVVAGVTRQDVLTDIQTAVQKAIEQGTTLAEFRKDFEAACLGKWVPAQDMGWRSRVIYETNIRSSYAAGRWQQLQDLKATHPFWEYRHGDSKIPRPEHLAWDGLTLSAEDPWWAFHYPPNDWGCTCYVLARDKVDMTRMGKSGPDEAPPTRMVEKPWGSTGETVMTPQGVGPGWGYSTGEATWGKTLSDEAWAEAQARLKNQHQWERLTPGDWQSYDLPKQIEAGPVEAVPIPPARSRAEALDTLKGILGGDEKVFDLAVKDWSFPVLVDASSLVDHLTDLSRTRFLPFLPEVLKAPDEVWLGFEKHKETGLVALRLRALKALEVDGKTFVMVINAWKGQLQAWTFLPSGGTSYLQSQRWGEFLGP
jgi:hypothetical protein